MTSASTVQSSDFTVAVVLLDIGVITAVARALSGLAGRFGQPAVLGEIIAGLALGPSLLGLLPGHIDSVLFPPHVRPFINVIAQFGLVLFMFGVGYELNTEHLRGSGRAVISISLASIVLPFVSGFGLGEVLYPRHQVGDQHIDRLALGLFLGAAMSITAFPVLVRVLRQSGLRNSRIGTLALMCAAINDLVAWILLAVIVTIVRASGVSDLIQMVGELSAFLVVLVVLVRPAFRRLLERTEANSHGESALFVIISAGLLMSSWATAVIGLHAVFGAFAFGAVMPRRAFLRAFPDLPARVSELSSLLLPVFFAVTGLSVDIGGLGWSGLGELAAIVGVACAGKVFGGAAAACLSGLDRAESWLIGVLLNTRGLTELVILGVGLQMGVLDERLFTCMVIMAVMTTAITGPVLGRIPMSGRSNVRPTRPPTKIWSSETVAGGTGDHRSRRG